MKFPALATHVGENRLRRCLPIIDEQVLPDGFQRTPGSCAVWLRSMHLRNGVRRSHSRETPMRPPDERVCETPNYRRPAAVASLCGNRAAALQRKAASAAPPHLRMSQVIFTVIAPDRAKAAAGENILAYGFGIIECGLQRPCDVDLATGKNGSILMLVRIMPEKSSYMLSKL